MWLRALALVLGFLLNACVLPHESPPSEQATAPLILISIDGLHPGYLDRAETPALDALSREGIRAQWMEPVFPSFTFPNHYSLATGLRPARHGIVANRMVDSESTGVFTLGDREQLRRSFWWEGEPIWVTAERQGLRAATLFWPGSEAEIGGHRPSDWVPYQHDMPHGERVGRVLRWLDRPVAERPAFITLYFSAVDSAGHRFGPNGPQVLAALEEVDGHIAGLLDGLRQRRLLERCHILVVSDHGMAQLSEERRIYLEDYIDLDQINASLMGPVGFFWPRSEDLHAVKAVLERAHPAMAVAEPQELPEEFGFVGHRRIPPLLALAKEGWVVTHRGKDAPYASALGAHGYDPRLASMRATFIARSPALQANRIIPPISVLDVYPLMAFLLGIEPAEHQGDLTAFRAVRRSGD